MADCTRCGRKMPLFSFGGMCKDCRAARAQFGLPAEEPASPATRLSSPNLSHPVTTVLLAVNFMVFFAMAFAGVSLFEPTSQDLLRFGANFGPLSLSGQPWRILSANYVHIGFIHIAVNMWALWSIGGLAERIFGGPVYFLIYTVCGIAGSVASLWWHPLSVGAGASGALFGIVGAIIAALYLGKLPVPRSAVQSTLKSLVTVVGYNLVIGFAARSFIDNAAHLGGLSAGLILGAVLSVTLNAPVGSRLLQQAGVFVLAAGGLFAGYQHVKQTNIYKILVGQGAQALDSGRTDEAIKDLEAAAANNPRDPLALEVLGGAYLKKKDYEKAAATLERAVNLDPNDPADQYNLGLAQINLGKYAEAATSFQKAVQLDPQDSDSQFMLGKAYQALGKASEAEAAFKKADELEKSAPPSK